LSGWSNRGSGSVPRIGRKRAELDEKMLEDFQHLEQASRQDRAQLVLQVEGLCELNKELAVKVEQQAAELPPVRVFRLPTHSHDFTALNIVSSGGQACLKMSSTSRGYASTPV
jgi:hypothetical protein